MLLSPCSKSQPPSCLLVCYTQLVKQLLGTYIPPFNPIQTILVSPTFANHPHPHVSPLFNTQPSPSYTRSDLRPCAPACHGIFLIPILCWSYIAIMAGGCNQLYHPHGSTSFNLSLTPTYVHFHWPCVYYVLIVYSHMFLNVISSPHLTETHSVLR